MTLGAVASVQSILGRTVEELPDADVTLRLAEADRKIRARHHTKYSCDKFYAVSARYGVLKSYNLFFTPKAGSTPSVYVNGSLLTETTDYALTDSTLVFSGSFTLHAGDLIVVFYIPEFFDDYANYLAAERIFSTSLVDTSNSIAKAVYDTIKDTVKEYERLANSKPHVAKFVDHKEDGGMF